MRFRQNIGAGLAGLCAGAINGLFGAGGGMVLVPLLSILVKPEEDALFPCSVSIIFPICLVSLGFSLTQGYFDWQGAIPYLAGSTLGGIAAGIWGKKIPTLWLHRLLGGLVLWGGVRYLC